MFVCFSTTKQRQHVATGNTTYALFCYVESSFSAINSGLSVYLTVNA